jgi:hypothetical protein
MLTPMEQEPPFSNRTSTSSAVSHSAIANPFNLPPYTGPALTPWQYEAFCRHVLSREYRVPLRDIKTGYLESPSKTRHQIDLYWTRHDGVCNFLCFANAKFLKDNIHLTEVVTLLGVQRDIRAHKAMLITNTGYSQNAVCLAQENGIALLIVRPALDFDVTLLPKSAAPVVAQALEKIAAGLPCVYHLNIVHRGFALRPGSGQAPDSAFSAQPSAFSRPTVPQSAFSNQHSAIPTRPPSNKMIPTPARPPRAPGPFGVRRK